MHLTIEQVNINVLHRTSWRRKEQYDFCYGMFLRMMCHMYQTQHKVNIRVKNLETFVVVLILSHVWSCSSRENIASPLQICHIFQNGVLCNEVNEPGTSSFLFRNHIVTYSKLLQNDGSAVIVHHLGLWKHVTKCHLGNAGHKQHGIIRCNCAQRWSSRFGPITIYHKHLTVNISPLQICGSTRRQCDCYTRVSHQHWGRFGQEDQFLYLNTDPTHHCIISEAMIVHQECWISVKYIRYAGLW